jgi:hypothetical protein
METKREGHLHFLDIDGDPTALWATECTASRPIPISAPMLGRTTTHPTSKLYFPHWCTGLKRFAMKTVELAFLREVFRQNGYMTGRFTVSSTAIRISKSQIISQAQSPSCPLLGLYSTESSRVLGQHIMSVGLSHKKISTFLWLVEDNLGLRTPGVFGIICERGKVYSGQTGCSMDARLREHQQHIQTSEP